MVPTDFIPIPGTKHVKYLQQNAEAINVEFTAEDDRRIRKAIDDVGGTKGDRYPAMFQFACFGDTPELANV